MHQAPSTGAAISSHEVETALERILASPGFRRAPRHSRFLDFVVRKTLSGATGCVKEYVIGVEVFDRPAAYDPSTEPIVRVEAGRLRSRLAEYYKTSGKLDEVRIYLPRGTYVPVFSRNGFEPFVEDETPEAALPGDSAKENSSVARQFNSDRTNQSRKKLVSTRRHSKTAIVLGAIAAVVGLVVSIRMLTTDTRPQSGRLEGSTLIVSNAEGKELWRKSFSEGFWRDYYDQGLASRMWFGDLNGDGRSEVLLAYHPGVNPTSRSTTLICYSDRGREKWRWTPGRELPELAGSPATFDIRDFAVLKQSGKTPPRIVVSSSHTPEYPDQVAIVDSHGKTVSEYWHSGHLAHLILADLDGDGREEILATGISNGYHAATLIVLDPDRVFGASTEAARPEIQIHGMGVAAERARLLFHRSDLNVATEPYNQGREITAEHGRTRLSVLECRLRPGCDILYDFDSNLQLLSVEAADQFRSAHTDFYRHDKDNHPFTREEEHEFQKVRCLVGCKTEFVPVKAR